MIETEPMGGTSEVEGEEDDGNIRLDPFVQPPILKALFEQLSLEDLANCRLVSKLWYEESLSTWRSNVTILFGKEGIVSTRDDGSRRTTSLGEFLDLWEAGEWASCPFKKFNLHCWSFEAWRNVEQDRFMELVGRNVTSLTLDRCYFEERENLRSIIYQTFPKLQFLKMDYCDVEDFSDPTEEILVYEKPVFGVHGLKSLDIFGCFPHSMMDMLSHFHKLKSLRLASRGQAAEAPYRYLLKTIRLIRAQDHTKLPLKNFDVSVVLEIGESFASSLELLKLHDQLNLPLQRLEIWFDHDKDMDFDLNNKNVIRDILQYHSSTLKYLEFTGYDWNGLCKPFPFFGCCLENLEELCLPSYFCSDFNHLRNTPNLRALNINDSPSLAESDNLFSNSSQLEIGHWTLPTLTELRFELPLSVCNLRKLMKWMPNVEQLTGLELNDLKLSMICKNWKNLKSLGDRGNELTDEGVIGIGHVHEAGVDEESLGGPNIAKLKNLTTFYTRSSKLTSPSVHEGFLKLPNLKTLCLGPFTQIDDESKAALEKRKIKSNLCINTCPLLPLFLN